MQQQTEKKDKCFSLCLQQPRERRETLSHFLPATIDRQVHSCVSSENGIILHESLPLMQTDNELPKLEGNRNRRDERIEQSSATTTREGASAVQGYKQRKQEITPVHQVNLRALPPTVPFFMLLCASFFVSSYARLSVVWIAHHP
jgi:hypothetical protein